ncbi:MAG: NUDIX hydrolase [Deltaproteobacteria bacterium]|nr:NUDIX hydrolase [Deltaproteobacteria bacterium]
MEKRIQTIATLRTGSFSVNLDEVSLRDGQAAKRIRIDHPEAAAIVAFVSEEEILMVRQYRYALGRETLEIPAGKVDPGEKPEDCAGRELLEETGYRAGSLRWVYTYAPALGYSNELIHIYAGNRLRKRTKRIDEREISLVEKLNLRELMSLVREGRIQDGKTLIGLAMTGLLRL